MFLSVARRNPYIDPRPNDDTRPFYWTDAEAVGQRNAGANGGLGTISFSDTSSRTCRSHPDFIDWRGTLMLADDLGGAKTINVYDGLEWGWDLLCHARVPVVRAISDSLVSETSIFEISNALEYEVTISNQVTSSVPDGSVVDVMIREAVLTDFFDIQTTIDPENAYDEIQQFNTGMVGLVDIPLFGLYDEPLDLWGVGVTRALNKAGQSSGTFQTELVALELHGEINTPHGPLQVSFRESLDPDSFGEASVGAVINGQTKNDAAEIPGDGTFLVDSFFDINLELSMDFGMSWNADKNGSAVMNLISSYHAADFNLDQRVDPADFAILANSWLSQGGPGDGDANGDGFIDPADFAIMAGNWMFGVGSVSASSSAVPEPSTVVLSLLAAVGFIGYGCRHSQRSAL